MKINWFSPVTYLSGISKYSKIVIKSLFPKYDIELFTGEGSVSTALKDFPIPYKLLPSTAPYLYVPEEGVNVYNYGNHYGYHAEIFNVSLVRPGIVILHDIVITHFFLNGVMEKGLHQEFLNFIKRFYGKKAFQLFKDSFEGKRETPVWEDFELLKEFPFIEVVSRLTPVVVVHSEYARKFVESRIKEVEVFVLPLLSSYEKELTLTRVLNGEKDRELVVSVIGHINPNKHVDKVVQAVAELKRENISVKLMVAGGASNLSYVEKLELLISNLNLKDDVKIYRDPSEKELVDVLKKSDMFVNIRYPNVEGASLTLVEESLVGKPVIVYNSGFYSELPDCYVKVSSLEVKELAKALAGLIKDSEKRRVIGRQIREYARRTFTSTVYVSKFEVVLESFLKKQEFIERWKLEVLLPNVDTLWFLGYNVI